jgi:ABC-type branched-subunit amino acid transport system substrate-binding protein
MRYRFAGWAALVAVLLTVSGCGGDTRQPFRIGVIVDCVGVLNAFGDGELAAAQLPLIARGARTVSEDPSDGIRGGRAAGRSVEIVHGCSESGEFSMLTQVARQLIERQHVDAVVDGGFFPVDGIPLRELARRYPNVVFVAAGSGPREVTLDRPARNLYRVAPDYGQGVAGLATYAYRRLGWRRVVLLPEEWFESWNTETAFVREFCALGGRVAARVTLTIGGDSTSTVLKAIPRNADVAVLGSWMSVTQDLLRALARRGTNTVVLGPEAIGYTDLLRNDAGLTGVVGASYSAPAASSPAMRAYLRDFAKAYPSTPPGESRDAVVIAYRNGVEALLEAFEQAHGDLSDGRRRLRAQLAHLDTTLLGVPVRMDANRQAVVSANLVRLGPESASGVPELLSVQSIPAVDQSVGGLIPASYEPKAGGEACRRAAPPPWAR